jgi:hypothetical protein
VVLVTRRNTASNPSISAVGRHPYATNYRFASSTKVLLRQFAYVEASAVETDV